MSPNVRGTFAMVVLSLGYLSYVFQVFDRAFWNAGIGDWVDPYLINFILEHWYASIARLSDPASPPFFHPTEGTLGFSHSLILYAPFYAAVRAVLHPFVAHNMTLVLVMLCGIVSLYALLRRIGGLTVWEALVLSAFFSTSPNVVSSGSVAWSQRLSVFLIPPVLLLALESRRVVRSRRRLSLAFIAGLLASLLFAHDLPTAALAFLLFNLAVVVPLLVRTHRTIAPRVAAWWRGRGRGAGAAFLPLVIALIWSGSVIQNATFRVWIFGTRTVSTDWVLPAAMAVALIAFITARTTTEVSWNTAFAAGTIVGMLVFLWIYVPASHHYRSFPRGHIFDSLRTTLVYESWRPFIAVTFAGLLGLATRRTRRLTIWFLIVSIIVLLIPLRFGEWSIWLSFFVSLPGFGAIREPYRIIYLYELAAALAIAALLPHITARFRRGLIVILLVLLAISWNRYRFSFARSIEVYARWVDAPVSIHPTCRSFFIAPASDVYLMRSPDRPALYGIDSMFIALKHRLPTLNGHSAQGPRGWQLHDPSGHAYPRTVKQWVARHALTGVCALDIDNRTIAPQ